MAQPNPAQRRRLVELARALGETGPALPGTLLERYNRCGKPNCRCKHDPPTLHGPYYQWTRKIDGKTVSRWLNPQQRERYQDWFATAQRARALVNEIEQLSLSIAETTEGWQ
jgi:Family of unknown function (DUF6788)